MINDKQRVLIVDDEPQITRVLRRSQPPRATFSQSRGLAIASTPVLETPSGLAGVRRQTNPFELPRLIAV